MNRSAVTALVAMLVLAVAASAHADQPQSSAAHEIANKTMPPPRPVALTVEQVEALEALAMQPEYQVDPQTRAAFSPEKQKELTESSTYGFYAGYWGGLLWLLIAAAPL